MAELHVFVSHSHHDNEFCSRLVRFLLETIPGINIFYDDERLHVGDDWIQRIQHEVIARPIFIVILSPSAVIAEWVREETNLALSRAVKDKINRRIIPVQINSCDVDALAPLLSTRQIIDLGPGAPQASWNELVGVVRGDVLNVVHYADQAQEQAMLLAASAHEAFAALRWRDTIDTCEAALQAPANQRDASIWGELGIAYGEVGKHSDALSRLDRALSLNAYRPDLWQAKAHVFMDMSPPQLEEALKAWGQARVCTGDPKTKLTILGDQYAATADAQQWQSALETCDGALEFSRNDPEWMLKKLDCLTHLHRDQDALLLVRELTKHSDATSNLWLVRARLAHILPENRHEVEEALNTAEHLAPLDPSIGRLRWTLLHELSIAHLPVSLRNLGYMGQIINGIEVILPPVCEVPAGPFLMGSDKAVDREADGDETPQHEVTLATYWIAKFQVSVAEYWCAVRAQSVPEPANWVEQLTKLDHPVVNITWRHAIAYCQWIAQLTTGSWRLPTEAEWEKAARGTDGRVYPWGNMWDPTRCNTVESGFGSTVPVGAYSERGASPCGAQDMASNVWDWCSSLYRDFPYRPDDGRENLNVPGKRVLHGASWDGMARFARVACRSIASPDSFDHDRGFRLAHDASRC